VKKVILVANDLAPSDALAQLAHSLSENEVIVTGFLGMGKLVVHESVIAKAIDDKASLVLVGMSSSPALAEKELYAVSVARVKGVHVGFFSDTFGCFKREHFLQHAPDVSVLFIASEAEREEAQMLYPNARVVSSGNPSWENLIDERKSEDEIRSAVAHNRRDIVLVPFNKTHDTNLDLALRTTRALDHRYPHIIFAVHPGEIQQDPRVVERYRQEIEGNITSGDRATFEFLPDGFSSKDFLRVSRMVVSACSPTTDLQAALLRVPVVNYVGNPETALRLKKEFGGDGVPTLCSLGAACLARDEGAISMASCLSEDIVKRQKKAFPTAPEKGQAVRFMTSTILLF